eukprot:4201644-Prymnesium_polylepis.2
MRPCAERDARAMRARAGGCGRRAVAGSGGGRPSLLVEGRREDLEDAADRELVALPPLGRRLPEQLLHHR